MELVTTAAEIRAKVSQWKRERYKIGFVPTMGYLHEGHQSLIKQATQTNDKVVVSIFVNPMQFGPKEDLTSYPRDLEKDKQLAQEAGADLIFYPNELEMYPSGFSSFVDMTTLTESLCGASRPDHFRGVCTVVCKLFNIVQPDSAYFGQKDAQQLAVIKQMVKDLNMPLEVVGCPIIREPDGLAKSSRNTYLNHQERAAALCLYKAICIGQQLIQRGEKHTEVLKQAMREVIEAEPLAKLDYLEIVDARSLHSLEVINNQSILGALAVFIGKTRLIDNFTIDND